jgi:putative tricarboxylic transport membrane protein
MMPFSSLSLLALGFLVLGGAAILGSLALPFGSTAHPGAGFYPLLVGIALTALSLSFLKPDRKGRISAEEMEPFPRGKDRNRVATVAVTLILFAILLKPLGYGISSALLLIVVLKSLGMREWFRILLIAAAVSAVSYFLFASILGVPLPRGIL